MFFPSLSTPMYKKFRFFNVFSPLCHPPTTNKTSAFDSSNTEKKRGSAVGGLAAAGKTISGSSPPEETKIRYAFMETILHSKHFGLRRRTLPVVLPAAASPPTALPHIFTIIKKTSTAEAVLTHPVL